MTYLQVPCVYKMGQSVAPHDLTAARAQDLVPLVTLRFRSQDFDRRSLECWRKQGMHPAVLL